MKMKGLTGTVSLDEKGQRVDLVLEVLELYHGGIRSVGTWSSKIGLNHTQAFTEKLSEIQRNIRNKTFIVSTKTSWMSSCAAESLPWSVCEKLSVFRCHVPNIPQNSRVSAVAGWEPERLLHITLQLPDPHHSCLCLSYPLHSVSAAICRMSERFRGAQIVLLCYITVEYANATYVSVLKHTAREQAELSRAREAREFTCSEYWGMAMDIGAFGGQTPCILHASNVKISAYCMHPKLQQVLSSQGMPYLGWKEPREGRVGNDRFEGFSVDLVQEIASQLHFKDFEIRIAEGNVHGTLNTETGRWKNGIMKDIVERTRKCCQEEVTKLWNAAKQRFPKKEDLVLHVQHEIEQLLREAAERKARTTLAFLNKGNTKTSNDASAQAGTSARSVQNTESADQDVTTHQQSRDQDDDPQLAGAPKRKTQPLVVSDNEDEVTSNSTPSAMRPTPAQDIMKEKIAKLRVELDLTESAKSLLFLTAPNSTPSTMRPTPAQDITKEKIAKLRVELDLTESANSLLLLTAPNSTPSTMRPTPAQDNMKEKIAKLRVELDLTERRKKSLVADGTELHTILYAAKSLLFLTAPNYTPSTMRPTPAQDIMKEKIAKLRVAQDIMKEKIAKLRVELDLTESAKSLLFLTAPNSTPSTMRPTPAQDNMKEMIAKLRVELDLTERRKMSLVADGTELHTILYAKHVSSGGKLMVMKRSSSLRKNRVYAMKHRENKKQKIIELCSKNPDAAKSLTPRAGPGRPCLEEEQSELLKAVVYLAMFGASAEERRRCEIVRTVHTLSELTDKLIELGFNISRSATYIRLLPRRTDTREDKRHVVAVPVKLSRPEADHHKAHQDQYLCVASIRSLETVTDDKARVPTGLIAANKQAPLVMHVEYKVSLPDHDFVIASRHKLISSLYALCEVKPKEMGRPEAVSYKQRPVLIISSDGGPDENPRYRKVIAHAVEHLKKYDLDAIFIETNAPGRSAFNRVERRMAPLSQELTGVVLPHDSFGARLDSNGRTVVKCDDRDCCSPRRSALNMILHDRLLSPPYPITQVDGHLTILDPQEHDGNVRRDLEERCCSTYGIYFSSITRAAEHRRVVHRALTARARKVRPSRIVTRRATDLLCASDNGLEWLNRNEVEGADDFTENHMDMLVPVVTLETSVLVKVSSHAGRLLPSTVMGKRVTFPVLRPPHMTNVASIVSHSKHSHTPPPPPKPRTPHEGSVNDDYTPPEASRIPFPVTFTNETCRTLPFVGGFSQATPISPTLAFEDWSIFTSCHLQCSSALYSTAPWNTATCLVSRKAFSDPSGGFWRLASRGQSSGGRITVISIGYAKSIYGIQDSSRRRPSSILVQSAILTTMLDVNQISESIKFMNCEYDGLALTPTIMKPRPRSLLSGSRQCRFCDRVFTYSQNSRQHERTAYTKSSFQVMSHYDIGRMQFVEGDTLKEHSEISKDSSTRSQQELLAIPFAVCMDTDSTGDYGETVNAIEAMGAVVLVVWKVHLQDFGKILEDCDSTQDDDGDFHEALTRLCYSLVATSDMRKAGHAKKTGYLFRQGPNEFVDRLRYLIDIQKVGDASTVEEGRVVVSRGAKEQRFRRIKTMETEWLKNKR
ncbi:hypothetical protein PR048_033038 [Dryococelus australis]|uniref:Ionotropic glutamate receptor L-glutamate and glycine-binding domain-containing protein n=1 Tax=Dryococelus australis TaxID=614101 RepID=A0ABQ9G3X5_9NEOP|nr:hypothetical protein PR048_033038 [Dryococelus australis]